MGRMLGLPERGVADVPTETGGAYEFSQLQNHTFSDLAKVMKFVGVFTGIAGAIYGLVAVLAVLKADLIGVVVAGIQSAIYLALGMYLVSAAAACRRIVETQGMDIPNLMSGLDQLRRYFALQRALIIIALIVLAIGLAFVVL